MMAKIKAEFIDGAIKTVGADRAIMETFWTQMEDFAAYCFPKAHAACYALIAYQTAYLKAHYPAAFMAALLTSDFGNIDRIAIEVAECRHIGIQVLPPDVNESFLEFSVVKESGNIRFGLSAIKNIGTGPIEAILAAREEGGLFTGIEDFAKRVSARDCNRKVWESLAKCGAFDSLTGGNRDKLLHNLDVVTAYAAKAQKNALSGQIDIFGSLGAEDQAPALHLELPPEAASTRVQLAWEKELLGLYISHHPLDDYAGYLADNCQPVGAMTPLADGKLAKVGGLVTTVRKITTKNGATMAFVGLEDMSGATELIVFPKAYEKSPELYVPDMVLMVSGKISARDRDGRLTSEPKIMVDSAREIDYDLAKTHKAKKPIGASKPTIQPTIAAPSPKLSTTPGDPAAGYLVLKLADLSNQELLQNLKVLLGAHAGEAETFIVTGDEVPKKIRLPFKVMVSDELVAKLGELLGQDRVLQSH